MSLNWVSRVNISLKGYVYILWMLLFFSCNPDIDHANLPSNLFVPLKISNTWIYEVIERTYSPSIDIETSYLLKDSVYQVNDTGAERKYLLLRSVLEENKDEWEDLELWSITEIAGQLIFTRANIPLVHFVFPEVENKTFDTNAFNTNSSSEVKMINVGSEYTTELNNQFSNTVTLVRNDNDDHIVHLEKEIEIFAKEIGMIEKKVIDYVYCQIESCLGQEIIDQGQDITISLKSFQLF